MNKNIKKTILFIITAIIISFNLGCAIIPETINMVNDIGTEIEKSIDEIDESNKKWAAGNFILTGTVYSRSSELKIPSGSVVSIVELETNQYLNPTQQNMNKIGDELEIYATSNIDGNRKFKIRNVEYGDYTAIISINESRHWTTINWSLSTKFTFLEFNSRNDFSLIIN